MTTNDELQAAREAYEAALLKASGDRYEKPLADNLRDMSDWLAAGHALIAAQQQRIDELQGELDKIKNRSQV